MRVPSQPVAQVWWLEPAHLPASALRLLDPEERIRVAASTDHRKARRRAAGWALLRCAVASLVGRAPQEVAVTRRCPHCAAPHGPPRVPGTPLRVSLSHAGDRVMVAVSAHCALGVDVEGTRPRPLSPALLRRALTAAEKDYLLSVPPDRRNREFLRAWTAKEAILKATGEGLVGGLPRLDLDLVTTPVRLRSWGGSAARALPVRLVELDPGAGHTATLATIGAPSSATVRHGDGRSLMARMTT